MPEQVTASTTNSEVILESCIKRFSDDNQLGPLSDGSVFERFVATQLFKDYDLSYEEIDNASTGKGNDGGIDTFMMLFNNDYIQSEDQLQDLRFSANSTLLLSIGQVKRATAFKEVTFDKILSSTLMIFDFSITEDQLIEVFNPELAEK